MYPILFRIGRITVYTYGLMMALSFLAAIWVISYSSKDEKEKLITFEIIPLKTYSGFSRLFSV